jgi:hypothetical protein
MSSQGASAGGIAAAAGGPLSALGTDLSAKTLMIIGVILLVLIIALVLYLRSGGKDGKAARAEEIREELRLRRELKELENA